MTSKISLAGACTALAGFLAIVAAGAADARPGMRPASQQIAAAGSQPSQPGPCVSHPPAAAAAEAEQRPAMSSASTLSAKQRRVVAANAVVTSDVPSNTVVGGIPARFIRPVGLAGSELDEC